MEVKETNMSIELIAQSEMHSLAISHGLDLNHSRSEDEDSEVGCDDDGALFWCRLKNDMADTLKDTHFNLFEYVSQMESINNVCTKVCSIHFTVVCQSLISWRENW